MTRIYYHHKLESFVVTRDGMPVITFDETGMKDYDLMIRSISNTHPTSTQRSLLDLLTRYNDVNLGWKLI